MRLTHELSILCALRSSSSFAMRSFSSPSRMTHWRYESGTSVMSSPLYLPNSMRGIVGLLYDVIHVHAVDVAEGGGFALGLQLGEAGWAAHIHRADDVGAAELEAVEHGLRLRLGPRPRGSGLWAGLRPRGRLRLRRDRGRRGRFGAADLGVVEARGLDAFEGVADD